MVIFFLCFNTSKGYAQHAVPIIRHTVPVKDTSAAVPDSAQISTILANPSDSLHIIDTVASHIHTDSTLADSLKRTALEDSLGIKISKDALPAIVKAEATDSAVLDMQQNQFYLYGKSQVTYEDLKLNAGKISYQQGTNIITAQPLFDTAGVAADKPTFTQGKEKFTYDSMQYNFKSKRAIVRNVHSQYGEGFVQSEQVKRNPDQTIYGLHNVYTTCALDTPHFGIVARRIKVIPGLLIVSGSANITIEGVPTPLFLPFGLFPISQSQHSGFILPSYTIEQARGLGLTNGGYYLNLSSHADLLLQSNIYTKGSYSVSGVSTYSERYQYSGGVSFSYAYNKTGEDFEPGASIQKDFMLNWRHQTDAKATPGQTFNASVQAGTSSFYSNNSYDVNQILQNQYQSNVSYSKTWQGTPFSLTVSALHNQNTGTKLVNVTLPDVNFHVTQLNPFQKKNRTGKAKWYDKITTSYTLDALNRTSFYDTSFHLSQLSLNSFQNGVHQTIPISASYTIFRFVNMSFGINYNEYWYTNKLFEAYNDATRLIDTNETHGFFTARDFNTSVSFSTRIYGQKNFKHGNVKGIRHVLTPTVALSYHPDFGAAPFNYYYRARVDSTLAYTYLSPYQTAIISYPSIGKAALATFGINNNLQMKVRSAKDTVSGFKNVTLIDALGINASYNAAADSFKWSDIIMSFRTNVLDKVNISASADFDPYDFNYQTGLRSQELMLDAGDGIARFKNATLALGSNFHSKPKKGNDPSNSEEYGRLMRNNGYADYVDFNIPWSLNVSYSLSAINNYANIIATDGNSIKKDTVALTHNVVFNGDFNLTERWKVAFSSGYDFTNKQLSLTSIDVYRDLHCWAMHLQAIPFGPRKSYTFTLNVKAAVLQDLKLLRRRDYRDAVY